jgi:type IV secretion system protein VirB9
MIRFCLAALLLAVPAAAQAQDARLVERLYDPAQVVRIDGRVNVQTTIRFGDDEQIENVAVGDSSTWQITPNRRANLLFVKPLAPRAVTNMTVVTNRRTYLFDLIASPGSRPLYVLGFTYPAEPETEVQLAEDGTPLPPPTALELAAANDDLAVIDPATLNFAWASTGAAQLLPERIYDNGDATFLAWPAGAPMPAILVKDQEGTEGPVNFAVRGDLIVLDSVPAQIILRSGEDMATLTNNGA